MSSSPLRWPIDVPAVLARASTLPDGDGPVTRARTAYKAALAAKVQGKTTTVDPIDRSSAEARLLTTAAAALAGDARAAEGFGDLTAGIDGRIRPDGSIVDGDLGEAAGLVEAGILAIAAARAAGIEVPGPFVATMGGAAWHLAVRAAPWFDVPAGPRSTLLAEPGVMIAALRAAALGMGIGEGAVIGPESALTLGAAIAGAAVPTASALSDDDWRVWTWGGGVAVLHSAPPKRVARIVTDCGSARSTGEVPTPIVTVDGVRVLIGGSIDGIGSREAAVLTEARVDVSTGRASRKAKIGTRVGAATRNVVVQRSRMVIEDELPAGEAVVRFQFGPRFQIETGSGIVARHPELAVKIGVDERVDASVEDHTLVLRATVAEGAEPIRTTVEWT